MGDRRSGLIELLRARLLAGSFLFDQPSIYEAGVEDTLTAIVPLLREGGRLRAADGSERTVSATGDAAGG